MLSYGLLHASQRIVFPSEVPVKLGEGILHQTLHLKPLLLGDPRAQAESLDASSDPDPGGLHRDILVNVAADLGSIHVAGVGGVSADAVVLLDDGVEHLGKILVGVSISSVDAAVLVVRLYGASNGLGESEAGGGSLVTSELVPLLLGHMLGHQRVLGLDSWELSHVSGR